MEMIFPRTPQPGDTMCFCTPSLPITPVRGERHDRRQSCIEWAEMLGLKPVFTPHFAEHTEVYSRASRQMRLEDFNTALDHPFVSIVGGGGGAISLLDGIDYAKARRNRPVVMGMSDQTKIVNALAARAGLVTYYGPNGGFAGWYRDDDPHRDFFAASIIEQVKLAVWEHRADLAPTGREESGRREALNLKPRVHTDKPLLAGTIIGGHWNAVAQTLSGTAVFPPPTPPMLICLEAMHDVVLQNMIAMERMRVLGYLENAAILCGGPYWDKGEPGDVERWLIDYCAQHDLPLVTHLRFGHFHPISVFPVGAYARFDTSTLQLTWSPA